MPEQFDVLILGSGPIAASTAYFLTQNGTTNVGVVSGDPTSDHTSAYLYAGGSIRWYWDDPVKGDMTRQTAEFIESLLKQGTDLSAIHDYYVFLNKGVAPPSLNISGKKLVGWFLEQAQKHGAVVNARRKITALSKGDDGNYLITTGVGNFSAPKVLLALGASNPALLPGYRLETELRQLFVLDLPVGEYEKTFPHTVVPINDGVAYIFIKKTQKGLRFLVGQEDVIETAGGDDAGAFSRLLAAGLGDVMPFLKTAHVEDVLWGWDAANKTLRCETHDNQLYVANCGSAIRSCVYIGREVARKLTEVTVG